MKLMHTDGSHIPWRESKESEFYSGLFLNADIYGVIQTFATIFTSSKFRQPVISSDLILDANPVSFRHFTAELHSVN